MGIQDLNQLLKSIYTHTRTENLISFKQTAIAIDALQILKARMFVANKDLTKNISVVEDTLSREDVLHKWRELTLQLISTFLHHQITPVMIFDGKQIDEKDATKAKRSQVIKDEAVKITSLREELRNLSPIDVDPEKVERLKRLLHRQTSFQGNDIQDLMRLCRQIGVPTIQATGEAEELCATLARLGFVSAVHSTDTDALVYGCPILIPKLLGNYQLDDNRYRQVECVFLDEILANLQLKMPQFRDLCILLGCDFNQRIRGIGPKKGYALMKKYGAIESFPSNIDTSCLKLERCREIFSEKQPLLIDLDTEWPRIVSEDDLTFDVEMMYLNLEKTLTEFHLEHLYHQLYYLGENLSNERKTPKFYPREKVKLVKK